MSCINQNCSLCRSLVISDAVTVVTINGTDTLVIDVPAQTFANGQRVCLVVAQTIPATATITMPVAISIGGVTTTVYPITDACCAQITACAVRTRKRYPLRVATTATGAVFKSLGGLSCAPRNVLSSIPANGAPATVLARTFAETPLSAGIVKETKSTTTTTKREVKSNEQYRQKNNSR